MGLPWEVVQCDLNLIPNKNFEGKIEVIVLDPEQEL